MKKKILYITYCVIFVLVCFIPAALFPFMSEDKSSENRELSDFPKIRDDDGNLNSEWTSQFDTYFSEHFAFRQNLVNLNNSLTSGIFGVSAEDDVVVGKDGWLYYSYTTDDYTGRVQMAQWELEDIAHTIEMMQAYAQEQGTKLIFTSVPNKNTVYPEYMPYNYLKSDTPSDLDRLEQVLQQNGISYLSLKDVLTDAKNSNPDKLLYHKTDSHWNNYGAVIAYNAIADMLGVEKQDFAETGSSYTHTGDLQTMLYPESDKTDLQYDYDLKQTYSYVGRFRGLDDININTVSAERNGSLLMFRDSFGEAILPFMAESVGSAQFSRTVPYTVDLLESADFDYAVLEIVERNLGNLRKTTPTMPAPRSESITEYSLAVNPFASCFQTNSGAYTKIYGSFDENINPEQIEDIYVIVNGVTYEAFPVFEEQLLSEAADGKKGYSLNIKDENVYTAEIVILTENGYISTGNINAVQQFNE